ncbi:hypothetical protein BMS3Abin15_00860 [bacterium BMS3Abin15]|nr:hypothetical protein BMS3Abin15_00860 [bacterium BMS3Abin15]
MIVSIVNDNVFERYRCHEIMRLLKSELSGRNIKAEVKDGQAFYLFSTFFKEARRGNCDLFLPIASNEDEVVRTVRLIAKLARKGSLRQNMFWRIPIQHSWIILPEKKYLIDYHKSITPDSSSDLRTLQRFPILKGIGVSKLMRIVPIKKLFSESAYLVRDVIYWETAIQRGNTIYYPKTNYSTKLRHAEQT